MSSEIEILKEILSKIPEIIKDKNLYISLLASLGAEATKSIATFSLKKVKNKIEDIFSAVIKKKNIPEDLAQKLEDKEIKEKISEFIALEINKFIDEKLKDDEDIKDKLADLEEFLKKDIEDITDKIVKVENGKIVINIENKGNTLINSEIKNEINIS